MNRVQVEEYAVGFELDHFFVAASHGAPEMRALAEAGFVTSAPHDHPGQGTASTGVFFANAYLEFLWLHDRGAARSGPIRRTGLVHRADPLDAACPFGFGLRHPEVPVPDAPFDSWAYTPPYLPEGASFSMGANSERLDEPLLFVLPWSRRASWETPAHTNGALTVTEVALVWTGSDPSPALESFLALGLVHLERGGGPLLRVTLDHAARRETLDLRPALPLIVTW